MKLDEVVRDVSACRRGQHCPSGGSRRDLNRLSAPHRMEFVQAVDLRALPCFRVDQKPYFVLLNVEIPETLLRVGLEYRHLLLWNMEGNQLERWPVAPRSELGRD